MPEIGLGIGRYDGEVGGIPQEILAWYDVEGKRSLDKFEQSQLAVEQKKQRGETLEVFLQSQDFEPDKLPG